MLAESATRGEIPLKCPGLDEPPNPADIKDVFSCVLGDGFHLIDRPKIPVHHAAKKMYKVAFRDAMFAWNPTKLKEVKDAMREDGLDDEEIEGELYYRPAFFKACVDRCILPPRLLYWRVRAVFSVFGKIVDKKLGKPLFHKEAWKKANGVLKIKYLLVTSLTRQALPSIQSS
jgi:hypothetical protein